MSDDASRAWQFYIDDMIGFADKATFPFSQTQMGVPYMRAVFLASLAARRSARPTPAANFQAFFFAS
jgi:hypothetical protein